MRVDSVIPRAEKVTVVLEAVGDDKVRVNAMSLDSPLVILANEALEVVAVGSTARDRAVGVRTQLGVLQLASRAQV
jgi:hypothetical protein